MNGKRINLTQSYYLSKFAPEQKRNQKTNANATRPFRREFQPGYLKPNNATFTICVHTCDAEIPKLRSETRFTFAVANTWSPKPTFLWAPRNRVDFRGGCGSRDKSRLTRWTSHHVTFSEEKEKRRIKQNRYARDVALHWYSTDERRLEKTTRFVRAPHLFC